MGWNGEYFISQMALYVSGAHQPAMKASEHKKGKLNFERMCTSESISRGEFLLDKFDMGRARGQASIFFQPPNPSSSVNPTSFVTEKKPSTKHHPHPHRKHPRAISFLGENYHLAIEKLHLQRIVDVNGAGGESKRENRAR